MTEDPEATSIDLANGFLEAEERQARHKEPTPKKYTGRAQAVQ